MEAGRLACEVEDREGGSEEDGERKGKTSGERTRRIEQEKKTRKDIWWKEFIGAWTKLERQEMMQKGG